MFESTYLGGTGGDVANSLVVSGGNVYVAGQTYSSDFPGIGGGYQQGYGGGGDAFLALLSGDLKTLTHSTYLGGTGADIANSLVVSGGNVYVAGYTYSSPFPGTSQGAQPAFGAGTIDAFVSLLSADLKTLTQSTYLGENGSNYANSLVFSGGVYVAGYTDSNTFPGTGEGAQPTFGGGITDAFVSLLSADLKTLTQSTYLGGTGADDAISMVVSGGTVYVAGYTGSSNFPVTGGGAQPTLGGSNDAFVSLLSADLKQLVRSTYLGGSDNDYAKSIAVSGGNVYVTG